MKKRVQFLFPGLLLQFPVLRLLDQFTRRFDVNRTENRIVAFHVLQGNLSDFVVHPVNFHASAVQRDFLPDGNMLRGVALFHDNVRRVRAFFLVGRYDKRVVSVFENLNKSPRPPERACRDGGFAKAGNLPLFKGMVHERGDRFRVLAVKVRFSFELYAHNLVGIAGFQFQIPLRVQRGGRVGLRRVFRDGFRPSRRLRGEKFSHKIDVPYQEKRQHSAWGIQILQFHVAVSGIYLIDPHPVSVNRHCRADGNVLRVAFRRRFLRRFGLRRFGFCAVAFRFRRVCGRFLYNRRRVLRDSFRPFLRISVTFRQRFDWIILRRFRGFRLNGKSVLPALPHPAQNRHDRVPVKRQRPSVLTQNVHVQAVERPGKLRLFAVRHADRVPDSGVSPRNRGRDFRVALSVAQYSAYRRLIPRLKQAAPGDKSVAQLHADILRVRREKIANCAVSLIFLKFPLKFHPVFLMVMEFSGTAADWV